MKESNKEIVIEVKDVKKKFKSYQDKASSLKERFIHPSRTKHEDVWVLNGISFQVAKGEAVGLIGKNGCGKSTTLKMLTKILYPNEGSINIKGRVSSLIELGAGFHPDMTGRENIYTNASIFGITRKEVDKRINDIIRFSELEDFIDSPVRTYSSGMYMRLAFAVAINVDADVLLIDEILAVGDASFQRKCFDKLQEIKEHGTTIVIVSHSMDQMYKICDRLIWIEQGQIKNEGVPKFIGEEYLAAMEGRRLNRIDEENKQKKEELEKRIKAEQERIKAEQEKRKAEELEEMQRQQEELACNETLRGVCKFYQAGARRKTDWKISYTSVSLYDAEGKETNNLQTGKEYKLELSYKTQEVMRDIRFVIGITREDGVYCYGAYTDLEKQIKQQGSVTVYFENALLKGKYVLDLWIESIEGVPYDSIYSLMPLSVNTNNYIERGILTMKHKWEVNECVEG